MRSIKDVKNLKGKKVLVRVDFNVITNNKVNDTFRILKTIPTLQYLMQKGAIVVLITHAGDDGKTSLKPVIRVLAKQKIKALFVATKKIENIKTILSHAKPGSVILLENIRQFEGEKKNDQKFAKSLASLADVYINDAFSVSHRKHATIVGIPKYLPSFAGLQLQKEVAELSKVFKPKHPFLCIVGGAKFDTKLPLIKKYLQSADNIFIGGALTNQVFKEYGFETGISLVEKKNFGLVDLIKNKKILLPTDVLAVSQKEKRNAIPDTIKKNENMVDIGSDSVLFLIEKIKKAKFILWNGPLGKSPYLSATKKILEAVAQSKAVSIIGGGDTIEIISKYKMEKKFTFVSTGGGATLTFLSERTLPGIEALK